MSVKKIILYTHTYTHTHISQNIVVKDGRKTFTPGYKCTNFQIHVCYFVLKSIVNDGMFLICLLFS